MIDIIVTEDDVLSKLLALKKSNSSGSDGIHPYMPKEVAHEVKVPLSIIFNNSLHSSTNPTAWKDNIVPIFMKGCRSKPCNYRPVSLTSVVCKVSESIIQDKMAAHLTNNNVISDHQQGLRRNRSCITQLRLTMEHWPKLIEQGNNVDTINLDFLKAFDTVQHQHLIAKMKKYHFSNCTIIMISSFLTSRNQRVVVNRVPSSWCKVVSGMPQRSELGQVVFLIFIADLPIYAERFLKLLADDTKLYFTANSPTDCNLIQHDIDQMNKWSDCWLLMFNAKKCSNPHNQYTLKALDGSTSIH